MEISGVYKITNTVTGDFYIGSSKDVKHRWAHHKCKSTWKKCPSNPLYKDMQKYGLSKFVFEIIEEVEEEKLKETEQKFIEKLQPTYNSRNANGLNIERHKESQKNYRQSEKYKEYKRNYRQSEKGKESQRNYRQSEKGKESQRKASRKYNKSEKGKESNRKASRKYKKSDKGKESKRKSDNKYRNQLCFYNGETLTLNALSKRFKSQGIDHPTIEAKKYLILQLANQI